MLGNIPFLGNTKLFRGKDPDVCKLPSMVQKEIMYINRCA